jgi:hypothetical protein
VLTLWHLGLRQNLVARLLINLGVCRIRFWYLVAPASGSCRETSRNYFWNLTQRLYDDDDDVVLLLALALRLDTFNPAGFISARSILPTPGT